MLLVSAVTVTFPFSIFASQVPLNKSFAVFSSATNPVKSGESPTLVTTLESSNPIFL